MNAETLDTIRSFALKEYEQAKNTQHDFGHVERVAKNALRIADVLRTGKELDTNLLQAACYLHDVVVAKRDSKNLFKQLYNHLLEKPLNKKGIGSILAHFDLVPKEQRILAATIINHPYSIPFRILNKQRDLYSKILQDADTLDYVSPLREQIFVDGKGKILTCLTDIHLSRIRKNIKKYLNFPELAEKINAKAL